MRRSVAAALFAAVVVVFASAWTAVFVFPAVSTAGSSNPSPSPNPLIAGRTAIEEAPTVMTGSQAEYTVNFTAYSLPRGSTWWVFFNGTLSSETGGSSISFVVPNGTYSFVTAGGVDCIVVPDSGSVNVSGASVNVPIYFVCGNGPFRYAINFTESGLPRGTNWTVVLNGSGQTGNTASIVFAGASGWYSFVIGAVSGFISNVTSGRVIVAGGPPTIWVSFSPTSSISHGSASNWPSNLGWVAIGLVAGAVIGSVTMWMVRRGKNERGGHDASSPPAPPSPPVGPS